MTTNDDNDPKCEIHAYKMADVIGSGDPPGCLRFEFGPGKWVELDPGGDVKMSDGYTPTTAAIEFWRSIGAEYVRLIRAQP